MPSSNGKVSRVPTVATHIGCLREKKQGHSKGLRVPQQTQVEVNSVIGTFLWMVEEGVVFGNVRVRDLPMIQTLSHGRDTRNRFTEHVLGVSFMNGGATSSMYSCNVKSRAAVIE